MWLTPGEPAPWFVARTPRRADFHFDTAAGRYVVLCFFGSTANPAMAALVEQLRARRDVFQDRNVSCFAVSCDPADERLGRVTERLPGFRIFWDFDCNVSALYGASPPSKGVGVRTYRPVTFVLDRNLRVLSAMPVRNPATHCEQVIEFIAGLPAIHPVGMASANAPVLVCPRVLEPGLCRALIEIYERHGGRDSGFMVTDPATGLTVGVKDYGHKRRRDHTIADPAVCRQLLLRMRKRLFPEVRKAFQFEPTHVERYIVACYDAAERGHFQPHRDNTSKGTAHRRFAVTINLNAEDYEGGDLRFPEYDSRTYRAPTGGAVVFSCSMLHEATRMRRGRRFCFLPFLYDEAGARVRRENLKYLAANAPIRRAVEGQGQELPKG